MALGRISFIASSMSDRVTSSSSIVWISFMRAANLHVTATHFGLFPWHIYWYISGQLRGKQLPSLHRRIHVICLLTSENPRHSTREGYPAWSLQVCTCVHRCWECLNNRHVSFRLISVQVFIHTNFYLAIEATRSSQCFIQRISPVSRTDNHNPRRVFVRAIHQRE